MSAYSEVVSAGVDELARELHDHQCNSMLFLYNFCVR